MIALPGVGNVYSAAGHYTLLRHLQTRFGNKWEQVFDDLVYVVEKFKLSLGFELVSRCLGEHAAHPLTDHLVLNVVIDRSSLRAYSPLVLVNFHLRYKFSISGMYWFETCTPFYRNFDAVRSNRS